MDGPRTECFGSTAGVPADFRSLTTFPSIGNARPEIKVDRRVSGLGGLAGGLLNHLTAKRNCQINGLDAP